MLFLQRSWVSVVGGRIMDIQTRRGNMNTHKVYEDLMGPKLSDQVQCNRLAERERCITDWVPLSLISQKTTFLHNMIIIAMVQFNLVCTGSLWSLHKVVQDLSWSLNVQKMCTWHIADQCGAYNFCLKHFTV